MTTELTKAAQQALESIKDLQGYRPDIDSAITALERALTQRPAAKTDEQWQETAAALNYYAHNGNWPVEQTASLPAPQQATPDVPETDFGNMATQQAAGEPVAALVRTRSLITRAEIAADGKDHFSEWGPWEPQTLSYAKAVTAPDRNAHPKLYEMAPLFTHPAPGVPEGWRDAKNDPPPVGVDVLVAAEFDGPGDWRIKVGGRNPEQRTGWWVFGASWVPQVWMPLDAHRAMLAAAQAKGGE